jgi:hypothetical protein
LLDRRELLQLLESRGYRMTYAFLVRASAPSGKNNGPPVERLVGMGRKYLYRADRALRWAEQNLELVPRVVKRRRERSSLHAAA